MKIKKNGLYGIALLVLVVVSMIPPGAAQSFGSSFGTSSFSSSTSYSSVTRQARPTFETYYGNDVTTYWPVLGSRETCDARSDLLLSVAPAGCSPVVVRSDLLAEQNVPVFCQIDSYKVNPLVDVGQVRNIRFIGEYPEEVAGVGFHPARAALRSQERLLGAPLLNNLGYAVVVLKRQPDESKLPENVSVTLSAQIEYNAGNSLGVGSSEFILREMSDAEWENEKFKQSFWNGRYFVRLEEVDSNFATVSIYDGDVKYVTQRIERGQSAREIYVPGVFCQAGLQISYDGFVTAEKTAKIEVTSDGASDVFEVTEGSYFFNNKCRVSSIDVNPDRETGRVVAYCNGKNLELILRNSLGNSSGQFVSVDGFNIAPMRTNNNDYRIDLSAHSDQNKKGIYILDNGNRLLKDEGEGLFLDYVDASGNFVREGDFSSSDRAWYVNLWTKAKVFKETGSVSSTSVNASSEAYKYFQEAVEEFESVAEDYPLEKRNDLEGTPTFGEAALKEAIQLAREFGAGEVERRLIDTYRQTYPDSVESASYVSRLNDLGRLDYSKAGESVDFEDKTRVVRLIAISEPVDKPSAELRVNGQRFDIDYRERKAIPEGFVNGTSLGEIVLDVLEPDRVRLSAYCRNENGIISTRREIYELGVGGTTRDICGVDVSFVSATTKEVAKLRINPIARGTETLTNLTINVGIEKRAFEITPEKAREKIENLNESIKEWEDTSEKLGNVVSGLKTACFATSAVLTFKNFATGLSGESLARQKVMNGENGWRARCQELVANGTQLTMDACYLANAGEIDSEVSKNVNALNKVNTQIQNIQSKHLNDPQGIANIFGQSVDADATRLELAAYARQEYGGTTIDLTKLKDGREWIGADGQKKESITVTEILSEENIKSGVVSTDAIREIMLSSELKKSGVSGEHLKNVDSNLGVVADRINEGRVISGELAKDNVLRSEGFASPLILGASGQEERVMNVRSVSGNQIGNINFGDLKYTATAVVPASSSPKEGGPNFNASTYILGLREADIRSGTYVVEKVWNKQTGQEVSVSDFSQVYGIGSVKAADRTSLNNEINNADRLCHFYETEPYRGMPAVIPFDVKVGWYAGTRQTLPIFGGIGAFDASGRVSSFWLCNVGENGRVEFNSGLGDDLCQQINLNTGQPLGNFPGLSESEARARINQAVRAIEDAARQYPNKFITINGERCEVGKPAVDTPGTQCQDFMSPQDCNLMFNVCDPVVCPSSRCDFGGTYPVANVAQTGIVGSTLLCLPNIREGIIIPVCLTGIKAGLDGWISIMRNYRDCLQENIETGQTVGICDQIHSIYLCEFFWGQVAPFVNVLIPKLIEVAYGQGVRGGGEYLTVQAAWQNMQNSVDYFTQSYAVNSLNAFQARSEGQYGNYLTSTASIGELGTELCQGFISAKAPKAFEALVESDSPPQFHAWFDEKTFTTATVPATSQYKVFYHVFAGNDAGVQFSVYLRNPPESSFYATNPYVQIASGFVPRGEYASQTWDGTAPAGYKELCVRINNEEECGFGQVSTSFAVNSLRDAYISDELKRTNIQSEQECVSGSNSPGALLNPNLQAGVEEFASPSVYNRGVVRVCATENPGKGTNPERFINVGNCGDPKIGCWLDERSVDRALTRNNVGARNETLEALQDRTREYLENSGEVYGEAEAHEKLDELEKKVLNLAGGTQSRNEKIAIARDLIFESDLHSEKLFFNSHKARLHLIRGQLYSVIARSLKVEEDALIQNSRPTVPGISGVPSSSGGSSVPGSFANCRVSNPRWTTPSGVSIEEAREGEEVWMVADASAECEDEMFEFSLYEGDIFSREEIPLELADEQFVENGILYYNWIVEFDESLSGILEGALDFRFEVRTADFSVTSGFSDVLKVREDGFIGPEEGPEGSEQPGEVSESEEYNLRFVEGNIWRVYYGDSATEIYVNGQTRAFYYGVPSADGVIGFANDAGRIVINEPQDEHSSNLNGKIYSEIPVVDSSASSQPATSQPAAATQPNSQPAETSPEIAQGDLAIYDSELDYYRLYYKSAGTGIYFSKHVLGNDGRVAVAIVENSGAYNSGDLVYSGYYFGTNDNREIEITNLDNIKSSRAGSSDARFQVSHSDYELLEFLKNNPVSFGSLLKTDFLPPKVNPSLGKWTLNSALDAALQKSGKYSANKAFVDELFQDGLITDEEYIDMRGDGAWNLQGDMDDLVEILYAHLPQIGE